MVELDGIARRIVLAPPYLRDEHVEAVIADAEIDSIVTDYSQRVRGIERPSICRSICRSWRELFRANVRSTPNGFS